MTTEEKKTPWKNGYWYNKSQACFLMIIDGEKVELKNLVCLEYPDIKPMMQGTWTYGDYGEAPKELSDATGIKNYNVEIDYKFFKLPGIINEAGTQMQSKSFNPGEFDVSNWVSDEEIEVLKEDREPSAAPVTPAYIKHQPGKPGKLIWFSGPPGVGKSTTAQLLARNHGYVYYEADCLSMFVNPFVDIMDPNPSMAQMKQKPLKGLDQDTITGIIKRAEMMEVIDEWSKNPDGHNDKAFMDEKFKPMLQSTAKDIIKQKERLGGDWSIAFAVYSRSQRELLREALPGVVFIVLSLSTEALSKRLKGRMNDIEMDDMDEQLKKFNSLYEPAGDDEENTHNLVVTEDMSPEDVVQKVLEIV